MTNADNFDAFWSRYPHKTNRFYASKCFARALKNASFDEIMAGLDRYIKTKPEWQQWAHASTWLNQRRWISDEPAQAPKSVTTDWEFLWRWRLRNYKPGSFWCETWGTRPEHGGDDVPKHILAEWKNRQDAV